MVKTNLNEKKYKIQDGEISHELTRIGTNFLDADTRLRGHRFD